MIMIMDIAVINSDIKCASANIFASKRIENENYYDLKSIDWNKIDPSKMTTQ